MLTIRLVAAELGQRRNALLATRGLDDYVEARAVRTKIKPPCSPAAASDECRYFAVSRPIALQFQLARLNRNPWQRTIVSARAWL